MDKRIRILLVDDRPEFLEVARAWLEKDGSTEVVGAAGDGREAIAAVERLAPDVVLMDAFMPRMDGFSAATAIKGGSSAPIVILISVQADRVIESEARKAGADGFLPKDEFSSRLPGLLQGFFSGW